MFGGSSANNTATRRRSADALLFAGALGALSWVALVRPALGDADGAFAIGRSVFAAADIVLAALLVLLAVPQSGYRLLRVRVAVMFHLAANTLFALTGMRSTFALNSPIVVAYLGLYVVLFAMGVRSRFQSSGRVDQDTIKPSRAVLRGARVAVLSSVPVVTGVAVAIAIAAEPRGSAMGVAAVAAVLVTLAAVRLRELHTADSKLVDSLRDQCDELHARNALLGDESERALAALREASDFLADMTERVAAPLNGVLESSDDLREATASAPQIQPHVDRLVHSSDTLLFIVNDLLGIAEASAAPMPSLPVTFVPRTMVTAVAESFVDAAAARGVDLAVVVDETVAHEMSGDRHTVEKVLGIFLDNAVKFSKRGEIELTTTFIDTDPDGSTLVRFAVQDEGIGMSRDHRDALLSQPLQAEAPARRYRCKPKGLALGSRARGPARRRLGRRE